MLSCYEMRRNLSQILYPTISFIYLHCASLHSCRGFQTAAAVIFVM